ncbi:MAG: FAD binding domain-containing protein [Oscillospiraceae bacterium]|nr:FAD binding domain-containing protein [Oscillospiraceae bacterium]
MRPFNHLNPATLEEAAEALRQPGSVAMAGGGDLLGALKDDIAREYPKLVVNLKSIPGLDRTEVRDGALCIGALCLLGDLSRNELVLQYAPMLAEAAGKCASPALRENSSIGGNLCQLPRCWYFRKLNNRFDCARKGGERCFALSGDNRYHSVFGPAVFENCDGKKRACIAVNQAELAPPLMALGAEIVTTLRTLPVGEFFGVRVMSTTVLEPGELLTEIRIPLPEAGTKMRYKRFSFRKSIDFPVVNLAIVKTPENEYRVALGGVAPMPIRAEAAEELLRGKELTPELAEAAGRAAVRDAKPTEANAYKLQLVKTLLKRELISMMD